MMSQEARAGTLMWVGCRDTAELRPIFEFCEENVSQIAVRRDLSDARRRSANNVRCVVLARHDRSPVDDAVLEKLGAQHPYADTVELVGPLCAGQTALPTDGITRIDWHRWNQSIPGLLFSCGVAETNGSAPADSVAVVAATLSDADPLMDLAAGFGAATVWCRRPGTMLARNFGAVWWDDSVATPASEAEWRRRIESVNGNAGVGQTNVWMTNHRQANQIAAAERAGVDVVLSKPLEIESLLATIGVHDRPALAATVRHDHPRAA